MTEKEDLKIGVEAVITSFNQGTMILEAVQSLCRQTRLPKRIVIVDDGSTDESSLLVLKQIEESKLPIPVTVHYQKNGGVSAARNAGIRKTQESFVLILDGDDKLEPVYVEEVSRLLLEDPAMAAASSYMHTFGTLDSVVCPSGGKIGSFLSHNCCPATHMFRREIGEQCPGYDESMRSGFEDWDFFLSMLETAPEASIGIVEKPLIQYRTTSASSNIRSMEKRQELMAYIIEKHKNSYSEHLMEALLGLEAIADSRLYGWEREMIYSIQHGQNVSEGSRQFLESPTFGDGGMAAAVRIASVGKFSGEGD